MRTQPTSQNSISNSQIIDFLPLVFFGGEIQHEDLSARQAFNQLRQNNGDNSRTMPAKCSQNAPDEINVFTDGSWLFPLKQFLGLGGAGVWWKGRTINRNYNEENNASLSYKPLSIAEQEMAHWEPTSEGLRIYTKVGGFGGSSTRTELAAGILALSAYGGVHIGSDSRAFVDKANQYIELIRDGKKNQQAVEACQ